ncbi:MAG: methyltransferase domain-containing protein [Nitrospiraceae bacterium]|nr:methyltransferase domain-containing protein [Nitrospiraceae bacterium]
MAEIALRMETFKRLRNIIYEESGIFIPDAKKYLVEKKVASRLEARGLAGFDDYLQAIESGGNAEEMGRLFDAITTNETSFFREPEHFAVLVEHVVPDLLGRNGVKGLSLWSSACSTGEEPYTMAIVLREKNPALRPNIYASDISNQTLESAKRAVYNSYSLRNTQEYYMSKYFKNGGDLYELNQEIKNAVRFMNINLADDRKQKFLPGMMDVIFCRNVLIYFDTQSKRKAVSRLYDSLKPGGYLFIGKSESLHDITRAFKPVIFNNTLVYKRTT